MKKEHAEEYTQSLGQIFGASWRQIALAARMGVPETLGYSSTREWVQDRIGGYVKLPLEERQEAVHGLAAEGMSQRKTAEVLGVDQKTISNDLRSEENSSISDNEAANAAGGVDTGEENSAPDDGEAAGSKVDGASSTALRLSSPALRGVG